MWTSPLPDAFGLVMQLAVATEHEEGDRLWVCCLLVHTLGGCTSPL